MANFETFPLPYRCVSDILNNDINNNLGDALQRTQQMVQPQQQLMQAQQWGAGPMQQVNITSVPPTVDYYTYNPTTGILTHVGPDGQVNPVGKVADPYAGDGVALMSRAHPTGPECEGQGTGGKNFDGPETGDLNPESFTTAWDRAVARYESQVMADALCTLHAQRSSNGRPSFFIPVLDDDDA